MIWRYDDFKQEYITAGAGLGTSLAASAYSEFIADYNYATVEMGLNPIEIDLEGSPTPLISKAGLIVATASLGKIGKEVLEGSDEDN